MTTAGEVAEDRSLDDARLATLSASMGERRGVVHPLEPLMTQVKEVPTAQ